MSEEENLLRCPKCRHDAGESHIGSIGRLHIFICKNCRKRFYAEEIPDHDTNVLARQKLQYKPKARKAS